MNAFFTVEQAWNWLYTQDFDYMDNFRFAYLDDPEGIKEYESIRDQGCCGSFDATIAVDGRRATIGCNYGH